MTQPGLRVGYVAGWSPVRAPGIGRYATQLLAGLRRVAPEHAYLELAAPASGVMRAAWTQSLLPLRLRRERVDVCHATGHQAPLAWRGPVVVTIHDLSLILEPATHPRPRRLAGTRLLRAAARRATAVIVPSQATARDVTAHLAVDPARVHVIPLAAAPHLARVVDPDRLAAVARRHALRPGYVLAVGTLEPRKNHVALVDAWDRLRAGGWDGQLVLAGGRGWQTGALSHRLRERLLDARLAGGVRVLGHVPDVDLAALLSLAGAFAFPSLREGFGLPVLEALACGVPTVTSDRGATAEVAGDAALLVDPMDTTAIAAALERALRPGPDRDRLMAAGPRHAAAFSWEAAARDTVRVYRLAAAATPMAHDVQATR